MSFGVTHVEVFEVVGTRFYKVAQALAEHGISRRKTILGGGALAAGMMAGGMRIAASQEASPIAEHDGMEHVPSRHDPEFLFAQAFEAGTWAPKLNDDDTYQLTLSGVAAATWFFSDRPDRVFGMAPMAQFLDGLGFTPNNPPNAALVATIDDGDEAILIIELLHPVYDEPSSTVTYDARVLGAYADSGLSHAASRQTDRSLPETFGMGSLFIDDCGDGWITCTESTTGETLGEGPVGMCWDWSRLTCVPCAPNLNMECASLFDACAVTVPDQDGNKVRGSRCTADVVVGEVTVSRGASYPDA